MWDISRGGLGVIEGREAIRAFFEEWWAAYDDHESEAEEIQDLGNGVAFAVFVQRGRVSPTPSRPGLECHPTSFASSADIAHRAGRCLFAR